MTLSFKKIFVAHCSTDGETRYKMCSWSYAFRAMIFLSTLYKLIFYRFYDVVCAKYKVYAMSSNAERDEPRWRIRLIPANYLIRAERPSVSRTECRMQLRSPNPQTKDSIFLLCFLSKQEDSLEQTHEDCVRSNNTFMLLAALLNCSTYRWWCLSSPAISVTRDKKKHLTAFTFLSRSRFLERS